MTYTYVAKFWVLLRKLTNNIEFIRSRKFFDLLSKYKLQKKESN